MIYLAKSTDTVEAVSASNMQTQIDQLDKQIGLLQKRLDAVANDPNAGTASLRTELADDMKERKRLGDEQTAAKGANNSNAASADQVMVTLSQLFGIPKARFELIYMLSRAILLEIGAMAATTPTKRNRNKKIPLYLRSVRLPVGHIMVADSTTTLCGQTITDGVPITINTPICGSCTTKWNVSSD